MQQNFLFGMLIAGMFLSCGIPKDPEGTWEKVQKDSLLVGIVHYPPYTAYRDGQASGTEAEMITTFAEEHGLKYRFVQLSESALVKQAKDYKLHILIGGFEKKTPWKKEMSATTSYRDKHILLVAQGENRLLYKLDSFLFTLKK